MGKAYKVCCPAGKEQILQDTVQLLNERLKETQANSGLTAREDIIMMAALNICHAQLEEEQSQLETLHGTQAEAMMKPQSD